MRTMIYIVLAIVSFAAVSGASRCSDDDAATGQQATAAGDNQQGGESSLNQQTNGGQPIPQADSGIPSPGNNQLAQANVRFGFGLLAALRTAGEGSKGNLFVSPFSVSIALAMTYNGASGETAEAMARVLEFGELDVVKLNQGMADLVTTLELAGKKVEIDIANSLWGREGFPFSEAFLERTRTYYDAQVTTLDFDAPDAPDKINQWVSDATRGKIDEIVDRIPPEIVLHLINAIYFKGQWANEFEPARTRDMDFQLSGKGKATVPMMSDSDSYRYMKEEGFQAVRLPYGAGHLAMYVFLPDEIAGLDAFLSALDENSWNRWMSRFRKKDGDVLLPRFKIEYKCLLNSPLREMGMGIAFDGGRADFSGMTSANADLYISKVLHKAVVEVNEEGTEAAAVTDIAMGVTSAQPQQERFRFVADHPFFFTIRDDRTGNILFVGILNDPDV